MPDPSAALFVLTPKSEFEPGRRSRNWLWEHQNRSGVRASQPAIADGGGCTCREDSGRKCRVRCTKEPGKMAVDKNTAMGTEVGVRGDRSFG